MRIISRIGCRVFAVGLVAIVGSVGGRPERAESEEPSVERSVAAVTDGPQDDPVRKADPDVQARARPLDLSPDAVRRCKTATALVEVRSIGSGSSVCVSAEGFFVTNHHVVAGAGLRGNARLVVDSGQKSQRVLEARIIKLDEEHDLALLKVDAAVGLVAIPLGTDDQLVETMPLAAFGYPFGRMLAADKGYPSVSVNAGTITALRRKGGELERFQLDASVNPGNSGGPVVDQRGTLIGIVVSGMAMARLNFAIPVSRVREFLAGPALVLRNPGLTFSERTRARQFEIDAYAYDRRLVDGLVVELSLTDSSNDAERSRRSGSAIILWPRARPFRRALLRLDRFWSCTRAGPGSGARSRRESFRSAAGSSRGRTSIRSSGTATNGSCACSTARSSPGSRRCCRPCDSATVGRRNWRRPIGWRFGWSMRPDRVGV